MSKCIMQENELMNYKKLEAKVKDSRTTTIWIDEHIKSTNDIEALSILATSTKASPYMLEALWMEVDDYKVALALAGNIRSPIRLLQSILMFTLYKLQEEEDWTQEDCEEIFKVIRSNPQTPMAFFDEVEWKILETKRRKEEGYREYEIYVPDEDSRDIMEVIDEWPDGVSIW